MATTRALSHLQSLIDLVHRADQQLDGLAHTLTEVNRQIDAVLDDEDIVVTETLVEQATGAETQFRLSHSPILAVGFILSVNGSPVGKAAYVLDAAHGVVTASVAVPEGATITATYTVPGLASQCAELLSLLPELDAQYFLSRKAAYEVAITWIGARQ